MKWKLSLATLAVVALVMLITLYYSKHLDLERQNLIDIARSRSVLPARNYCPVYVNRQNETRKLMNILNFHSSAVQIVGVVGSPTFGKSCLAINVGHDVMEQGVVVNFVNLRDVPNIDTLATKILNNARFSHSRFDSPKSTLLQWLRQLNVYTLLVLDDCDDFLHLTNHTKKMYDEFEEFIVNVTNVPSVCPTTTFFKVLFTSQTTPPYFSALLSAPFEAVEVKELLFDHADDMIAGMVPTLDPSIRFAIVNLTGKSPLALRITGALLTRRHPVDISTVLSQLENDPIPFLTDELNVEKLKPVGTSINVSYMYLDPENQRCGRILANFPGSFQREAAHAVLASKENMQTYHRLTPLVEGSLLEYDTDEQRYIYHRLIRAFFVYVQQKLMGPTGREELNEFKAQFFRYYTEHLHNLTHLSTSSELLPSVKGLGSEEHNLIYLLENFENVVNHSAADQLMHLIAHAFRTKFLPNNIATRYLLQPLKLVVDHFEHKIKQNITLNSKSLILYGELVNILSSVSGIQLSELKKSFPVTSKSPHEFPSTIDYVVFLVCNVSGRSPVMDGKSESDLPMCDGLHNGEVGMAYYRNAEYGKTVFYLSSFLNSSSIIVDAVEDSQYFYHLYRALLKAGNGFSEVKSLVEEHPITKRYLSGNFDIPMSRESYDWIDTIISYLWATKRLTEAISVQNQLLAFRIEHSPWLHSGGKLKKFDLHENCMVVRHAIYEGSVAKNSSGAIALIEDAMDRFQKRNAGAPVYMGTPCITTERDQDGHTYSLFYYGKALISSRRFVEGVLVIENVMDRILDVMSWKPESHCFNQLLSLVCSYRIYEGDLVCVSHILSSFFRSLHAVVVEGKAFDSYFQANYLESAFHCVCNSSGAYFADSVSTMQWLPFSTTLMEVGCAFIIVTMLSVIVLSILYFVSKAIKTIHFIMAIALGIAYCVWSSLCN